MTLTANGLPSTHYYEWYKNGVLVSGSGGVGKTTLNINSLGNYTVRAVINQTDATKYSCYKETAISIQERVLYAQASKVNACIGETITLTAKGATGNVTWSPATNLNVTNTAKVIATPTAVGSLTYNVTAEVPLGNAVINGEFENGNTGFSSNLTYVAPTVNLNQNQYSVRKSVNPQGGLWKECPDHTTGSGNLFYTDGPTSIGASVWKQTISVQPNTNYTFSAWVANTYASSDPSDPSYTVNATNARFQLQANGQALLATPFAISGKTCKWENVKSVWNSGNNTSITIAVLDMNADGYGNDFALDDITFGAPGTQTDKVTLNVTDCFFVNAAALTTCKGDSVQIEAETNGLFAGWQLQGGGTTGIKSPNNPIT
jgi:GTPase SAR1 family protein